MSETKFLQIDFEYRKSYNEIMELVCVAYSEIIPARNVREIPTSIWLHKDPEAQKAFSDFLNSRRKSHILLCFNASAEARSFLSLGLNPRAFRWVDVHVEWKMALNNHPRFMYGKIAKKDGTIIESEPLTSKNLQASHEKVGTGLNAMVCKLFEVNINNTYKEAMRDLILGKPEWDASQKEAILVYCQSDIIYLYPSLQKMPQFNDPDFLERALWRGRSAVNMAICESNGYPLNMDAIFSFAANYEPVKNEAIASCNRHYPFFVRVKKSRNGPESWVESYEQFRKFVEKKNLLTKWPKVNPKSSRLSTDSDTLKDFAGIPEIAALRSAKKILQQAKWFRPDALPEFLGRVGDDEVLRGYLNAYGTATSRNAPGAKTFILAMASWMRYFIRPPEGYAITGIDYSSQEFAIAAALSDDKAMIKAYESGDPYLSFAKLAGAVPNSATRQTHGAQRDLFKATVLASQFGMGAESLSLKIAADTGKSPDFYQANDLLKMHREVFWRYYDWLDKMERDFRRTERITLHDGWVLWFSNDREKKILSVRNHPVQGTGACIMRYALEIGLESGLKILSPLHDAIYHMHRIEETEEANARLERAMDQAVDMVFHGKIKIRHDSKTISRDDPWVEPKGKKDLELMKPYLDSEDGILLRMALFDERI